jgi:hypothetical protein
LGAIEEKRIALLRKIQQDLDPVGGIRNWRVLHCVQTSVHNAMLMAILHSLSAMAQYSIQVNLPATKCGKGAVTLEFGWSS